MMLDILLDSLKCFVMRKSGIFFNLTHKLQSVYVPGYTNKDMSKVNIKVIEYPFQNSKTSSPMGDDRSPGSQHNVWRYHN